MSIEDRRKLFWGQSAQKRLKELQNEKRDKISEEDNFLLWLELEDFQCSKESYIKKAGDASFSTFAVIKDGKWYERGSMGWWGCVSNEKEDSAWDAEFSKLLQDLSEDTLLSVFDCHI